MTGFKFEKAIKLLVSYFPEETMKKPTLFHSLRVGTFLWNNGYSEDLQIAGLLHDALEDTDMLEKVISDNFLFYVKENNISEIERCMVIANLVLKYKKDGWNDKIFNLVDEIIKYN